MPRRPRTPSSTSPTRPRSSARSTSIAPSSCCTAPPGRTSTAPRRTPRAPGASTRRAAATSPAPRARSGAALVGFSTDYVFAGDDPEGYDELSPVGPRSVYGATKLAGERALLAEHPEAHVVRTAWVFSPRGRNFLLTMLRLGAERDELRVVDDQIGCPTATMHLAARDARAGRALPAGHLPPGGVGLDELARLRERDHGGRRARARASCRSPRASCSARPRARPARSCEPSTPAPRGCHTGGTGCATVSPPWPTRRQRETDPRDRRLRLHRLAFRAADARAPRRRRGREPRRAHVCRQPGQPRRRRRRPALPLRARLDQRRRGRRARGRGLRRDRQLRRRDARRPLDHGGRRLHPDRRLRHLSPARVDPRPGRPARPRLDRRGLRRHRGRLRLARGATPCARARPTRPRRPAATSRWSRPCAPTASTP